MKKICLIITVSIYFLASIGFGQDVHKGTPEHAKYLRDGAQAKLTLKIVDENGTPVSGAKVGAHFEMQDRKGIEGTSNTNGLFTMEDKSQWKMHYGVEKEGYYKTVGEYMFGNDGDLVVQDGKWQPWDPEVRVVLRPVVNPIPMYAKRVETRIPVLDQFVGFDLEKADWVVPYGEGQRPDAWFNVERIVASEDDFEILLTVAFTNSYDGIVAIESYPANVLQMARHAPVGGYKAVYERRLGCKPGSGFFNTDPKQEEYSAFRVRTVVDDKGAIQSSYYGKFSDGFRIAGYLAEKITIQFTYYLNPTPNDRNLEFDPKRNLFKDLKSTEQVTAP